MAKPTPGPWTVRAAYGNHGLRIDSEASGALGHIRAFIPSGEIRHGAEVLMRWEEGFANARAVECLPAWLEALERIAALSPCGNDVGDARAIAQAALALLEAA